jgi:hypothetical protein
MNSVEKILKRKIELKKINSVKSFKGRNGRDGLEKK